MPTKITPVLVACAAIRGRLPAAIRGGVFLQHQLWLLIDAAISYARCIKSHFPTHRQRRAALQIA
jgi:hypothetical protein